MTQEQMMCYDNSVQKLYAHFCSYGISVTTGVNELCGLEIADSVGHVRTSSRGVVFKVYNEWVKQCLEFYDDACTSESKSSESFGGVLPPWTTCWSEEYKCPFFLNSKTGSSTWSEPPRVVAPWFVYDWDETAQAFIF